MRVRRAIGYIRLERFSRKAGDEVQAGDQGNEDTGDIKGLVLDLRGIRGLLDAR